MHVLITNDDGIAAPGLLALEKAAALLGWHFTVVAPALEHSQCGHRVTTHQPLKVEDYAERRYAVHGTPADCVRIALFALDVKPDLVLSGINAGGNMGQDIFISGTVAAAREAAYHGVRSFAFSHYMIRQLALDWDRTAAWTAEVLQELQPQNQPSRTFWNVNFPHLPPGEALAPPRLLCQPAHSPLQVAYIKGEEGYTYSASYASRPQDPDSDVAACFSGNIAISLVSV